MSATAGVNASIVGAPALTFHNDGIYIRADNANTQTSHYFLKAKLAMHCDDATSFLLKSEKDSMHYLFADVVKPAAASVKALLEVFQSWIEDSDANREGGPFVSDATTTVLEVKTFYDKDPLRIDELLATGGSTTYDAGRNSVAMDITTATTARAVRQTKAYALIVNSKMMYAVVAGVLISSTSARNVFSRIGCFEEAADISAGYVAGGNGLFFQFKSGEGLSLVLRSNLTGSQVDTVIPQASWNVDVLDGTGASAKVLDPTVEQTFVFEWSALKGQVIRAGFMQDGRPIFCHKFLNTRMGCASIPLRWEIGRLNAALAVGDNDAATMYQGVGSVMIQGNNDGPLITRSFTNTVIKPVTAANSPQALLTLSVNPAASHGLVQLRRVRIINFDQGLAKWSLVLNPSANYLAILGATSTFSAITSYAMRCENAPSFNGAGQVLASGFVGEGSHVLELGDRYYALTGSIKGPADMLSLVIEYVRGVVTVTSAMEWSEKE